MENLSNIQQLYLGSVLTFFALVLIEYFKSILNRRDKRRNLKVFIRLELLSIIKLFDRLKKYIEENATINYIVIDATWKIVNELEKSHSEVIYLSKMSDRERFYDLISDIASFLNDARFTQQFYYDQKSLLDKTEDHISKMESQHKDLDSLDNFFAQKRTEKLIELIEMKRRVEEYINEIGDK